MNRFPLAAAAFCGALLAAAPINAQERPREPQILVTGEGEAVLRPDLALLSLAVMRQAATAGEALEANSTAMREVVDGLKAMGIAERDLQTAGLQINPRYEYLERPDRTQETKLVGYEVTNTLSVRVRDIAKAGAVIDKAVTLGVNQGGSLSFSNEDTSDALAQARREAVRDAMDKARTLAEAAGVKLGRVTEISDTVVSMPPIPMMAKSLAEARAPAPAVEPGENSYRVQINMSFALE